MKTQMTATVVNGTLKLDQPIDLPDDSRVTVLIEPVPGSTRDSMSSWKAIQERSKQSPLHTGGHRFSREELYERD